MAYPPLTASRRPRRRATVAILIILALVVGVILLAVRYRTERRDSVDYLALAKEIADEHVVMSDGLADLFVTLGDLDRPDILQRVERLGDESGELRRSLDEATVTAAVGEANGYFLVAISSWDAALSSLADAIIAVLDGEDEGRQGGALLADAFADLRVGDRAYEGFRGSLDAIDPELVTRNYPDLAYVGEEREALYDAALVANHLRTTLHFVENRDVSIRATTDPEPLGNENGVRVIPDSESFAVQVVVTNEGNVTAELITVSLRLTTAGEELSDERSEIVAVLEPDEATTVPFAGFSLVPGVVYELQVNAQVADDDVPDNNIWELVFVRNEP